MGATPLTRITALTFAITLCSTTSLEEGVTESINRIRAKGELYVFGGDDDPFCSQDILFGPTCNYNGSDQVVVIPEGFTLPFGHMSIITIQMAKTLHIYPACIFWITVTNIGLVTVLPYKDFNSKGSSTCRPFLQVSNSQADTIAYNLEGLGLLNSSVNVINLSKQKQFRVFNSVIESIDTLHWVDCTGKIHSTTIHEVSQVLAEGDLFVTESLFGSISNNGILFNAQYMMVVNSTISRVATRGIRIIGGKVNLTSIVIEKLESHAIVMEDPLGLLILKDVAISSAVAPCIVLPDRERISLNNVTIGDASLNFSSPYLKFEDDFVPVNDTEVQVEATLAGCSSENTRLTCDFVNISESIRINALDIEGYQLVQIKNAKSLEVTSTGCNLELQLHSVNVTLPHFAAETRTNSTLKIATSDEAKGMIEEECSMTLSVSDSYLNVVSGKYVSNMTLKNSTLMRLHKGTMKAFNVEDVNVVIMDSVNITGSGSKWLRIVLGSVLNFSLQAPIIVDKMEIRRKLRKGAIIIDHANATTEISNVLISNMQKRSMVVKRGTLILKEVRILIANEAAIYVEEGATVELDMDKLPIQYFGFISVASRDQVTLKIKSRDIPKNVIYVRHPSLPPDLGSNLTISNVHQSPFCRASYVSTICDFSPVQNASVVVDIENPQQRHLLIEVRHASFVTLYPSCIKKVYLEKVTEATTVNSESDCITTLEAHGVHFKNITAGIHDVTLTSSSVELLSVSHKLYGIGLQNTRIQQIEGLYWSERTGVFKSCYIGNVIGFVASSKMIMFNITIETVRPRGITVLMEGEISNSVIQAVDTDGIRVLGNLHMVNVVISSLAKKAIVVEDGLLILSNVSIVSSDEMSIIATANGGVAMQNVTVAGERVYWPGYIADATGPTDLSLVFVNKYINKTHGGVPIFSEVLDKFSLSGAKPSAVMDSHTDFSLWKSTSISLIVVLVLMLICCIIYIGKLFISKRGILFARVSWQANDDQTHLL